MPEFKVTPWEVKGIVDYDKLLKDFGLQKLDDKILERLKKHSKELHFMLRRKIFFAHRDLEWLLNEYEKGNNFFLYTGRGPSGNTTIGHLLPWVFTKWLQDKFGAELYFQMTDDEKFLFKEKLELEQANSIAYENALDVIALGFDSKKTFIFADTDYSKTLYKQAIRVAKHLNFSTAKAVFGFTNESNVGQIFFTSMQAVPAFLPSILKRKNIPCLIPLGFDQDPHFRVARDILPKLGYYKPSIMHSVFLPSLKGMEEKMSASDSSTTIYTTDSPEQVEEKIKKYAFSGGQPTIKEHREKGGNPNIDICFQYLKMFFEPDDKKLLEIEENYKNGSLATGELKEYTIKKINYFLAEHQRKRKIAKKDLEKFILRD